MIALILLLVGFTLGLGLSWQAVHLIAILPFLTAGIALFAGWQLWRLAETLQSVSLSLASLASIHRMLQEIHAVLSKELK